MLVERDLGKQPLSEAELKDLFGGRDPREFLNPRNDLYREMKMAENPPSPGETIRLMAKNPNLIRRPIVALRLVGMELLLHLAPGLLLAVEGREALKLRHEDVRVVGAGRGAMVRDGQEAVLGPDAPRHHRVEH